MEGRAGCITGIVRSTEWLGGDFSYSYRHQGVERVEKHMKVFVTEVRAVKMATDERRHAEAVQ